MGLEVLKSKVQKMTLGQTHLRKEQTVKEHFTRWSHGGSVLSLPQFRMALSELGVPARTAEDIFSELDQSRRGNIEIQTVISRVVAPREVPEHPLHHVRGPMQNSRSHSAAELTRAQEPQPQPSARAPSVPSSPAGGGLRASLDPEAVRERKIRSFWDLIGNRAAEKGFRSVAQLLKAMDKDATSQLDRMEARRFFKVILCLAVNKADEFFNLLDDDRDGKVSCRELSRCLVPYLEKNYRPEDLEYSPDEVAARADREREQELIKYWELIGNRAHDKGFKSAGQLMLQLDKDDDGFLDRKELRTWLTYNVGFSQKGADHMFDLLDIDRKGRVSSKEIRRRLEPYFGKQWCEPKDAVPDWRGSGEQVEESEDREQELKKFWHLIGTKFHERGYRSSGQVLLTMDKDDSNFLDRAEVRSFFERHLGHGKASADRFFDLLDAHGRGAVSCRAIAQCLAPYFQSTFREPGEMVSRWEAAPSTEPSQPRELRPPAGRASLGGPEGRPTTPGRPGTTRQADGGSSTPGRPGMTRHNSMPSWTPSTARGGMRERLDRANGAAGGGAAPTPLASPARSVAASDLAARGEEERVAAHTAPGFDTPPRSRPSELGPPRRGTYVGEEAPLPANRASVGSRSQVWERQAQPPPPQAAPEGLGESLDLSAVVLAEFRRVLVARGGTHGIHQFGRTFRIMDTSGNMKVSLAELDVALRRFGLNLKQKDLAVLMSAVDQDGSGTIAASEFLKAVRGPLPARRQQLINVAFDCLDRNRSGQLEVSDVQHLYDVSHHPEVLARTMTQDAALEHFLSQFDGAHHDGIVTRKEFSEYYANVSASIDDDDHFEQLMRNAWRSSRSWPTSLTGRGR